MPDPRVPGARLKDDARDLCDLKMHISQRNLYGVDIDEFAVNIAMLRIWHCLAIGISRAMIRLHSPIWTPRSFAAIACLGQDPSPDDYGDLRPSSPALRHGQTRRP